MARVRGTHYEFSSRLLPPHPDPLPASGERSRHNYAAAVVTPPSTTMVWPVMKVEASEAR